MEVSEYISSLPSDRQVLLKALHNTIMTNDPSVKPVVISIATMLENRKKKS